MTCLCSDNVQDWSLDETAAGRHKLYHLLASGGSQIFPFHQIKTSVNQATRSSLELSRSVKVSAFASLFDHRLSSPTPIEIIFCFCWRVFQNRPKQHCTSTKHPWTQTLWDEVLSVGWLRRLFLSTACHKEQRTWPPSVPFSQISCPCHKYRAFVYEMANQLFTLSMFNLMGDSSKRSSDLRRCNGLTCDLVGWYFCPFRGRQSQAEAAGNKTCSQPRTLEFVVSAGTPGGWCINNHTASHDRSSLPCPGRPPGRPLFVLNKSNFPLYFLSVCFQVTSWCLRMFVDK